MSVESRHSVQRAALAGLLLRDPFTRQPVSDGLRVVADGEWVAKATPSGAFAWIGRPRAIAPRRFAVTSLRGEYRPLDGQLNQPPAPLVTEAKLVATTLYRPPQGATGIAGSLVDGSGHPVADARVWVELALDATADGWLTSSYSATSDGAGAFVALLGGLALAPNEKFRAWPDLPGLAPSPPGTMLGWLAFGSGRVTTFTAALPVRTGRIAAVPKIILPGLTRRPV